MLDKNVLKFWLPRAKFSSYLSSGLVDDAAKLGSLRFYSPRLHLLGLGWYVSQLHFIITSLTCFPEDKRPGVQKNNNHNHKTNCPARDCCLSSHHVSHLATRSPRICFTLTRVGNMRCFDTRVCHASNFLKLSGISRVWFSDYDILIVVLDIIYISTTTVLTQNCFEYSYSCSERLNCNNK